ncbi:hypothetical protein ACFV2H_52555 [Streptomyces sp. NPDC059629]|uniref:hypothetical protein n=1 Tax=Streptomyces sp. NPDC059629 TaxID=3346889 RepID=UPI0036864E85
MTETRPKVWVGDQVYDPDAKRQAIVTDVQGGTFYLRPVYMSTGTWTADPDRLEVTVTREELLRRRQEEP